MTGYIIRRLLQMIPVIILVTLGTFLLLYLNADPVRATIGVGEDLTQEQVTAIRHELGFDKPIPVQYAVWLGKVVRGDLGRSNRTHQLITTELKTRLPVTLQLGLVAWLFGIVLAIPAGVLSATRRGTKLDILATVMTISGAAIPGFWLGIMLIMLFGVVLRWLPTNGFVSLFDNPAEGLKYLVLPAFSLGLAGAAMTMRQTRSAMLEVLAQDYIRTARAKGLSQRSVVWVHALKNALLPVITIMGLEIGRLLGGAVIIETLFAIPGMGRLIVQSIMDRDFPVIQACVLIVALAVLFSNLVTDLLYGYLNPKIRYN